MEMHGIRDREKSGEPIIMNTLKPTFRLNEFRNFRRLDSAGEERRRRRYLRVKTMNIYITWANMLYNPKFPTKQIHFGN